MSVNRPSILYRKFIQHNTLNVWFDWKFAYTIFRHADFFISIHFLLNKLFSLVSYLFLINNSLHVPKHLCTYIKFHRSRAIFSYCSVNSSWNDKKNCTSNVHFFQKYIDAENEFSVTKNRVHRFSSKSNHIWAIHVYITLFSVWNWSFDTHLKNRQSIGLLLIIDWIFTDQIEKFFSSAGGNVN